MFAINQFLFGDRLSRSKEHYIFSPEASRQLTLQRRLEEAEVEDRLGKDDVSEMAGALPPVVFWGLVAVPRDASGIIS